MNAFAETKTIRLRESVTTETVLDGESRTVAAGTEGTIVDVLPSGALLVEFMLAPPQFDASGGVAHGGTWHMITLTPDQIAPA